MRRNRKVRHIIEKDKKITKRPLIERIDNIATIVGVLVTMFFGYLTLELTKKYGENQSQLLELKNIAKKLSDHDSLLLAQLSVSVALHEETKRQLTLNKLQYEESKIPKLVVEQKNIVEKYSDNSFTEKIYVTISNLGGDIYNLKNESIENGVLDPNWIPNDGFLPRDGKFEMLFYGNRFNKPSYKTKFVFNNSDKKFYEQVLEWTKIKGVWKFVLRNPKMI